jgi:hypothetical protein
MSSTNTYTEQKYCVYITNYFGDLLPPNYIGSTSITKIKSGYRGSVNSKQYKYIWKSELKSNPDLFYTEIISVHYTRREALWKELELQKLFNVVKNPLFINKSYSKINGFFGMSNSGKDNPNFGKHLSPEAKKRISESRKNCTPWNKGKTGIYSEEYRQKISNSRKGKPTTKGMSMPTAANNGRIGAAKQSITVTGRKLAYRPDGSRYWVYPTTSVAE